MFGTPSGRAFESFVLFVSWRSKEDRGKEPSAAGSAGSNAFWETMLEQKVKRESWFCGNDSKRRETNSFRGRPARNVGVMYTKPHTRESRAARHKSPCHAMHVQLSKVDDNDEHFTVAVNVSRPSRSDHGEDHRPPGPSAHLDFGCVHILCSFAGDCSQFFFARRTLGR
jgi:hypothetical protein